jgi:hypothetical protein
LLLIFSFIPLFFSLLSFHFPYLFLPLSLFECLFLNFHSLVFSLSLSLSSVHPFIYFFFPIVPSGPFSWINTNCSTSCLTSFIALIPFLTHWLSMSFGRNCIQFPIQGQSGVLQLFLHNSQLPVLSTRRSYSGDLGS